MFRNCSHSSSRSVGVLGSSSLRGSQISRSNNQIICYLGCEKGTLAYGMQDSKTKRSAAAEIAAPEEAPLVSCAQTRKPFRVRVAKLQVRHHGLLGGLLGCALHNL
jgi:hypothetical protein